VRKASTPCLRTSSASLESPSPPGLTTRSSGALSSRGLRWITWARASRPGWSLSTGRGCQMTGERCQAP
jgi:hypothetical protein